MKTSDRSRIPIKFIYTVTTLLMIAMAAALGYMHGHKTMELACGDIVSAGLPPAPPPIFMARQ